MISAPSSSSACCFCTDDNGADRSAWDEVLLARNDTRVLPTKGSLVPGWVLVVPNEHRVCLGAHLAQRRAEILELTREVRDKTRALYGRATVFEHGPSRVARPLGCGIDHTHLHVAPLNFSLKEAVQRVYDRPLAWNAADPDLDRCRVAYEAGTDYLFVEEDGVAQWTPVEVGVSQLFRRAIALRTNAQEQWDYRRFTFENLALETVRSWSRDAA